MKHNKLKGLRISKDVSIEKLSEIIEVHPMTYRYKENGKYPFTITEINKIIEYFELPYEQIFFEQGVR